MTQHSHPDTATAEGWRGWCAMRPDGTLDRSVGVRDYPGSAWKCLLVSRFGAPAGDRDALTAAREQAKRGGWKIVPVELSVRSIRYVGRFDAALLGEWRMGG